MSKRCWPRVAFADETGRSAAAPGGQLSFRSMRCASGPIGQRWQRRAGRGERLAPRADRCHAMPWPETQRPPTFEFPTSRKADGVVGRDRANTPFEKVASSARRARVRECDDTPEGLTRANWSDTLELFP